MPNQLDAVDAEVTKQPRHALRLSFEGIAKLLRAVTEAETEEVNEDRPLSREQGMGDDCGEIRRRRRAEPMQEDTRRRSPREVVVAEITADLGLKVALHGK
jgi:hypothetical protein